MKFRIELVLDVEADSKIEAFIKVNQTFANITLRQGVEILDIRAKEIK